MILSQLESLENTVYVSIYCPDFQGESYYIVNAGRLKQIALITSMNRIKTQTE